VQVGTLVLDDVAAELVGDLLDRSEIEPGDHPMAVACSGGADSTALAVLAAAAGRTVTLHHVDHQIRPGGEAEADRVARLAAALGAVVVRHVVVLAEGDGLEDRARRARRAVLPEGAATGHTMDDQAETVLLNLLRGAGSSGLAAMRLGPEHPILGLRRSETRRLCALLGLEPLEDPSNEDLALRRNDVRHRLLPLAAEVAQRDVVPLLARTADLARSDEDLLARLSAEAVPDVLAARDLAAAPRPLATRAVRRWLTEARDRGEGHPPTAAEVDRVLAVAANEAQATELAGGLRVSRSGGRLRLSSGGAGTLRTVTNAPTDRGRHAWADGELGDVILTGAQIADRVAELGAQITADYADNPPLIVCVLKGAMHFISDLTRAIDLPVEVDFMAVSSYGSATKTSGIVRIVKDLDVDLTDRHVLVVEDIIDSGLTLNYLRKYLSARIPASIEVCTLLLKEGEQRIEQDLRYVGFTIPPTFVVGYGLDVAERYRNLDGVYTFLGDGAAPGRPKQA
jgi:hypoxanthine phosphoribosyltransferase